MRSIKGMGVALVTPFDKNLSIDFEGLERLVEFNINNGADYFVVLGTTGESATLSFDEKEQVKSCIKEVNKGRLPLVLGIGGNNTDEVVKQISQENLTDGFDAILSVSPYYNRPSQEGIYRHYLSVAQASLLPLIMYNVPSRTGSNMLPQTAIRLAKAHKNIIGIKEAAGSMDQALRLLRDRPNDFLVISGDDMLALPMVSAGGDGVISVIGQGLVSQFSSVINNGLNGAFAKAYKTHYNIMEAIDLIFEEGNPTGIKTMLAHLGICKQYVRLPLVEASENLDQKIQSFLKRL